MPRDVEYDHRVEELGNGEIVEVVKHRRIFTDQDAYDFYAQLLFEKSSVENQMKHADDTTKVCRKKLARLEKEVEKWKDIAERALERLKLNDEKNED